MTTQTKEKPERERSALMLAIDILDEKKRELVARDIGAWFILYHAKLYLMGAKRRRCRAVALGMWTEATR